MIARDMPPEPRCLVCETPSRGHHFGVQCCRACAAFYRRTMQLGLKYKCRFEQNCDLSQKNRYTCRFCRYEKCLRMGMSSTESSTSSPLADSEQEQPPPLPQTSYEQVPNTYSDEPINRIPTIVKNTNFGAKPDHMADFNNSEQAMHASIQSFLKTKLDTLFSQDTPLKLYPYAIPLTLCQQAMVAYTNHTAKWPDCVPERLQFPGVIDMTNYMQIHYQEVENIATFCMSIEPFAILPFDEKWFLFKHFWHGFIEMDRTFITCQLLGWDIEDDRQVFCDGTVINFSCHVSRLESLTDMDEDQIRNLMKGTQEVFKNLFTIPFKKFKPDRFELMYMIMSMMWNIREIEGIAPATVETAEHVRNRLSEDLYNYYTFELNRPNYAERIYKLSHLVTALDRISERRQEDSHLSRTFNIFKHDVFLDYLKL